MSQGLFAAVSGMKANQSKLDVISDNIANMSTTGFKSSTVTFENVFSKTLSSGSAPSGNMGGTNPMQVGLGVTVGDVSRNFSSGSIQTTGRSTDLNIQGEGFFTLSNPNGGMYLSRAGNFSVDSEGYLVNPKGLKVLGTSSVEGGTGSTTPIQIPTAIDITRNPASGTTKITNTLNSSGTPVTEGTFDITVGGVTKTINTTGLTIQGVADAVNALNFGNGAGVDVTASISGGKFNLKNNNAGAASLTSGTSNFISALGLPSTIASSATATSGALRDEGNISLAASTNGTNTVTLTSVSIANSGAIEATYSNGDKLTVTGSPSRALQINTASGINVTGASLNVASGAVNPQDLQLQLSKVVNSKGLIAEGGNMFSVGPNAGSQTFGTGGANGMGGLSSGSLESSNVDLTSEFAELVVAQRGLEANSKTFSAQNQILQTVVNLVR